MSKNLTYLNARLADWHVTKKSVTLVITTLPVRLLTAEIRRPQAPPGTPVEIEFPDPVRDVIGDYHKGRFLRVAIEDQDGPLVGIGAFGHHRWLDLRPDQASKPIVFPEMAPMGFAGIGGGWVNKRMSKPILSRVGACLKVAFKLFYESRSEDVEFLFTNNNMHWLGTVQYKLMELTEVSQWDAIEGRYVRSRRNGKLEIGNLIHENWMTCALPER